MTGYLFPKRGKRSRILVRGNVMVRLPPRKADSTFIFRTYSVLSGGYMKGIFARVFALAGLIAATANHSGYRLASSVQLPGAGGWGYLTVDASARRVYISHASQVEVLDADSQKSVGTIPDTPGVHGIALATSLGRGFISAGKSDSVVVFHLKTLKAISSVKTGTKPDANIFDPATNLVFAMNGGSDSTTAINAADGSVAATIDLGGGPEFSVADGAGKVWVN